MARNYDQSGDQIPFTAAAATASGQVVKIGHLLGVSLKALALGETGPVQLKGVFSVPKVSGAVIAKGEPLVWDVSANSGAGAFDDKAATPATGDISGAAAFAFEAAGDGVTTMRVCFTGVPGTLT